MVAGRNNGRGVGRERHLGEGYRRRWKRGWEAMEKAVEAKRIRQRRIGRRTRTTRRPLAVLAWASIAVTAYTMDAIC